MSIVALLTRHLVLQTRSQMLRESVAHMSSSKGKGANKRHRGGSQGASVPKSKKEFRRRRPLPGEYPGNSSLQTAERDLRRKQFVMEHFQIPGKYQKFFTGRLRKRERSRMEKQLETKPREEDSTELKRIAASTITVDESVQRRKVELMRSQILRILERHLASNSLPVKQLSMQYWEVTDVLVSFNLRTAVCCYKVTAKKDKDGVHPYQIRKIIKDSAKYLNLVVNQELEKGISRGMGAPRTVSLRFTNSASTSKLIELMQDQISASENTAGSAGSAGSADGAANKDAGDAEADGGKQ